MDNRIYRSRETKMMAGVCGGIADMFNIDPTLVRLVAVALIIFSGMTFLLVYIMCAIIIPLEPSPGYIRSRHQAPSPGSQTERRNGSAATAPQEAPVMDAQPPAAYPLESNTTTDTLEETSAMQEQQDSHGDESTHFGNDETVIRSKADTY